MVAEARVSIGFPPVRHPVGKVLDIKYDDFSEMAIELDIQDILRSNDIFERPTSGRGVCVLLRERAEKRKQSAINKIKKSKFF